MQVLSESDIHIFLEYARSTTYYALFYTALFTGMRRSELLALRWCDVDLLLCQISVSRTLLQLRNRDIIIRQPKTAKERRLIALSPSTAIVLREHRLEQENIRQSMGVALTDDDLVFSQYDGNPLLPDSITKAWRNVAKHCGLNGVRLHDARHTHASIQITLDTYSHVAPGLKEAAANRFNDIVIRDKGLSEKKV